MHQIRPGYCGSLSSLRNSEVVASVLSARKEHAWLKMYLTEEETQYVFSHTNSNDQDLLADFFHDFLQQKKIPYNDPFDNYFQIGSIRRLLPRIEYPRVGDSLDLELSGFASAHEVYWFEPLEYWILLLLHYCKEHVHFSETDIASTYESDYLCECDHSSFWRDCNDGIFRTDRYMAQTLCADYQGLILQPWVGDQVRQNWLAWYYYMESASGHLKALPSQVHMPYFFTHEQYLKTNVIDEYARRVAKMLPAESIRKIEYWNTHRFPYHDFINTPHRVFNFVFDYSSPK